MSESISRRSFVATATAAGVAAAAGSSLAFASEKADSAAAGASAGYTPGTYKGESMGAGYVTVEMTFDATSITDVKVDVSGETNFVGAVLGDTFQSAIMDAQSADIDAVATATMTSDAVRRAAAQCIAQATGAKPVEVVDYDKATDEDWLGEEPQVAEDKITETVNTDIVIVGAGNGGCAAAAYAAKNGLDFKLIEKYSSVGETRHWFGAVDSEAAQEAGAAPVDRKKLLSEISRFASGKVNQRVVRTWINESADMFSFERSVLEGEMGYGPVAFTSGDASHWPDECNEQNTVYLFPEVEHNYRKAESDAGMQRNEAFAKYVEQQGYEIDFNRGLVKLERDDSGRVTGLIAQDQEDGHYVRYVAAKGVLLACGGYPGNPYMMQQLDPLGASATTAVSYTPRDRGYGIRAAVWAGADMDKESAPMLFDRGLVAPGVDAGYADNPKAFGGKEFPGTVKQYNPGTQPFLKVNRRGERFMNESQPYNDAPYAATNQPGHVYAQICDANVFEDITRFHTVGCSAQSQDQDYLTKQMQTQVDAGLLMKADTLDELADKLGFTGEDKQTFLATVDRYNELFDAQDDEDFGKPSIRLSEIRTAPFYGCWLASSLLTTLQGIKINENMQALDKDAKPIEGLYVCGDNSGSFFANNYPCLMPGLACGRTMTEGIKAVKQMGGLE